MASIEISEERGIRYLHFGSHWIQGAMRIARPWALELEYTREMMLSLLLHPTRRWPNHVLQIGLGAASITKFLHRNRDRARLTIVEIAPEVVTTARQYFKLPDDSARLTLEIGDGNNYVASTHRRFDLIVVDGFDAKGHAGMLDSVPFYHNCRARLTDSGVIAINLLGRRRGAAESIERFREVLDDRVLVLPPSGAGNIVAFGATGPRIRMSLAELRGSATRLKTDTGLNLLPTVDRLIRARGDADPRVVL